MLGKLLAFRHGLKRHGNLEILCVALCDLVVHHFTDGGGGLRPFYNLLKIYCWEAKI